jgi:hypothetical protein
MAVAALVGLAAAVALRGQTGWLERVLHLRPAYLIALLPGVTAAAWTVASLWHAGRDRLALLFSFATAQSLLYGYAGEKVPWLVVHVAVPWMAVASAALVECWDRTGRVAVRTVLVVAASGLVVPSLTGTSALLTFNRSNVVEPMLQVEYGADVGRLVEVLRDVAGRVDDAPVALIERDLAMPFTWYLRDLAIEYPERIDDALSAPVLVTQQDVAALRERYVGRRLRYHVWSRWLGALRWGGPVALVRFWIDRSRLGPRGAREFYVWVRRDVEARRALSPSAELLARHALDRAHGGAGGGDDVALLAAEVEPAERPERPHLEDVDAGVLLGLVGGNRRIGRRLHLEHEQALPREQQAAVPHAVDELHVVRVDVVDDLAREDPGLPAVLHLQPQRLEDRRPGRQDVGLRRRVHLEQPVEPLDDLHAGPHRGGLHGHVGDPVDLDAGRDLHPERRVVGQRQESLGHRAEERRVLRLQRIEEHVGSQVRHAHLRGFERYTAVAAAASGASGPREGAIRPHAAGPREVACDLPAALW